MRASSLHSRPVPTTAPRVALATRGAVRVAVGWAALALVGCADVASERDVRATILDEAGRPIPGALFWADARDASGPIGWILAVAGQAGEVPDSAREPLKIAWRPGARMTLAAFAPGRRPAVLAPGDGRVVTDGAVLTLDPSDPTRPPPPLDAIAFPFETRPDLAARVRDEPAWTALAAAFREALAAREASGEPLTAAERRKADFLDRLEGPLESPEGTDSPTAPGHSGRISQ